MLTIATIPFFNQFQNTTLDRTFTVLNDNVIHLGSYAVGKFIFWRTSKCFFIDVVLITVTCYFSLVL